MMPLVSKASFQLLVVAGCIGFCMTPVLDAMSQEQERENRLAMREPVPVSINSGSNARVRLLDVTDEEVVFELPGGGQGSFQINDFGDARLRFVFSSAYSQAVASARSGVVDPGVLKELRSVGYPLVRFAGLPPEHTNFREPVLFLLQALVDADETEEAVFLLGRLDVGRLGPAFEERALGLVERLWLNEEYRKSLQILEGLAIEKFDRPNLEVALQFLIRLRQADRLEDAARFYSKVALVGGDTGIEASLWRDYCRVRLGEYDDNRELPTTLVEIEPEGDLYPLRQLVLGHYYQRRSLHDDAMRAISSGLAYATPIETWTAELMFRSAECYVALEEQDTAQAVFREVNQFFPNSPWAEASRQRIAQ